MHIWVIETGEPLPLDGNHYRALRAGLLSNVLHQRGHRITWWASTLNHASKELRANQTTRRRLQDNFEIVLLHGMPYKRNVSIQRLINHWQVAREFTRLAKIGPQPDLIYCCVPTLDLARKAVDVGAEMRVPVVLDYRDLWPEVFIYLVPPRFRPLVRLAIWPLLRAARRTFARATALVGITDVFVAKAAHLASRPVTDLDRAFPHGYIKRILTDGERLKALEFWKSNKVDPDEKRPRFCFIGNISKRHEFKTIIDGFSKVKSSFPDAQLILCGTGEALSLCKQWAGGDPAIVFPGHIAPPEIVLLMECCLAGLIPYPSTPDFAASYPNKAIEYLSGGLPVLSSIQGLLKTLLDEHDCGATYTNCCPDEFCQLAESYCRDRALHDRQSQNSAEVYRNHFDADHVYHNFAEQLEMIRRRFEPNP